MSLLIQPNVHINWLGVIPRSHIPKKKKKKNGIRVWPIALSHTSVDAAAAAAARLVQGINGMCAYRINFSTYSGIPKGS